MTAPTDGQRSTGERPSPGSGHEGQPPALLVDSDESRRAGLASAIEGLCGGVDVADDEYQARSLVERNAYGLVVVAAELSSGSGLLVAQRLRSVVSAAILVTAPEHSSVTVVAALEVGADDCCAGSASLREIRLRAEMAIARRRALSLELPSEVEVVVAGGRLRMDPRAQRVTASGLEIELTPKQFGLLLTLARSPGRVYSRRELLEIVWGSRPEWQSTKTVTEHVHRIRGRLRASGVDGNWIESVNGIGYRFLAQPRGE